jgi:excisionase family DNA binding protein
MIAAATNPTPKMLFTLAEAAEALSVHERTLSRLIRRGEIRAVRIGPRGVRVSVAELQRWIESQQAAPEVTA